MTAIRSKKGYDLNIEGKPSLDVVTRVKPSHVAALPERIPYVKPRLKIEVGDPVKIGTVLFVDKRNPDIRFLSPGGGYVEKIDFGPRRVIKYIIIKLDESEESETFDIVTDADLEKISRENLIQKLIAGGVWPLLRELPFRDMADPENIPPHIFVSLDAKEPFQPEPAVYLRDREEDFAFGLKILQKLAGDRIRVTAPEEYFAEDGTLNPLITHTYSGHYPAGDPGVILYHIKTTGDENRSWYIKGQDLLLLARLLKTGRYPTERIIAFSGKADKDRYHVKSRIGAPLTHIAGSSGKDDHQNLRYISGGVLTGYGSNSDGFLGWFETSLALIPEGDFREFLGFLRPGFRKSSYSRTFLSSLTASKLSMDCNTHGGERACIACGYCNGVCPVDILPELAFKAVLADDVDEFLSHGLLDCVECGLCTYVCPSKIELAGILKDAKSSYYKELTS